MSEWVELKAADGHELSAYVAKPKGEPLGAVIVIQEIFGVNPSIRSVADDYASNGFVAIAPALFDRFEKSLELGYTGDDLKRAFELYGRNWRHWILLRRPAYLAQRNPCQSPED
jgi:carboxymethylenebutenolidase